MSAYYGNIDYSFDKSTISLLDKKKEELHILPLI
jgi:hypothetical protein